MTTTVIRVDRISKRFVIRKEKSLKERLVNFGRSNLHKEDFWALRDVDLTIHSGSTVGLVGPNGSGKSTLLKVIGGIIQPSSGRVDVRGRLAALLELGAGFHPDLTGRENVYLNASILGLSRRETEKHFDAIVDFSGIEDFIDTQVKFYSSGMYVRLAFAVAVHVDPDILLVDEVLAVGDEPFQRKCMERIRRFQHEGRTIVFVSHSLDQVADLCDRAVVLEHGAVRADGHPRDSLRTLRNDFAAARQADIEKAQGREEQQAAAEPDAPRPPRARVTRVQALVEGRPLTGPLASGSPLTVRVEVEAAEPLSDWILGFGIDTPLGHAVLGTNTRLLGIPLGPVQGTTAFDFDLAAAHLGEGSYTAHGAIAAQDGAELHRLAEAVEFEVRADDRVVGVLAADLRFRGAVPAGASAHPSAHPSTQPSARPGG